MEGPSPTRLLPTIARNGEGLGFLQRKKKEADDAVADGSLVSLPYRWVLFIDRSRGDESAVGVLNVLYPGINWGSIWVKKWKMNRRILFVWMRRQEVKGKEEFLACRTHRIRGVTVLGVPVQ